MKRYLVQLILVSALVLMAGGLSAQTLSEAASQAARQHNAKVLSAHTEQQGDKRVHVIKLLTSEGVVKTVRVTVREG
jgi:outer membrane lipoprotein-sorting protein